MQSRAHVDEGQRWWVAGICIFLAAITFAVFAQTFHYGFVNLDDDLIVTDNTHVTQGLSPAGVVWAFTHFDSFFYTPLTCISHMADCSMHGLDAGGHHFTNVLIHAISAILLFLVLREMTGALWRSAFVAALFAIHPLHVESVAWISERKDVLSGLFFMLALGAYVRYARREWSLTNYLLVVLVFTLSLLSKPMVVTLPFLFLLLDYWPLDRFRGDASGDGKFQIPARLILEKIPLLALSAIASVIAVLAEGVTIQPVGKFSMPTRVGNAAVACMDYIVQMFHPVKMAVFYPHPGNSLPGWRVILSMLALVCITAAVLIFRKKHRYLVTGWFWYLGMLAPVSGIVQVGIYARADRFTYLSQIGLYLMGAWLFADWAARWPRGKAACGIIMAVVIGEFSVIAWGQASYWKDSVDLWEHALECTTGNFQAENNLGAALYNVGRVNEAIFCFQKALEINPGFSEAHNNLGGTLLQMGRTDEAIPHFQEVLETNPRSAEVHNSLGDAYYQQGEDGEAIAQYEKSLEINPSYVLACNNLAWIFATSPEDSLRNGPKAMELAREADGISAGGNPAVIRTLAAACAEAGQFSDAVEIAQRALRVADSQGNKRLAALLGSEIKLYSSRVPYHRAKHTEAAGKSPATP